MEAQIQFERVPAAPPAPQITADFDCVENSSIAFADIDGDNDQDVLITGWASSNQRISKLYRNDGNGNYKYISGTPFEGVSIGSVDFADIDGDNDLDVLITGRNDLNQETAKLYRNDGSGNFTLINGTPFDGVRSSSIVFADIDGDNDQDVLITGIDSTNQKISKLYINNGLGNFTLLTGAPFNGVAYGSVAFADIDGDGDLDVLITGSNNSGQYISELYTNDGYGGFSLLIGTPFDGVYRSSVAFADIDGDNDFDVLITGRNNLNQEIAKLYRNDGSGNYSIVSGTTFDGVQYSSVAFSDIDGDGDQDVLITGANNSGQNISKLYSNDGNGNYGLISSTTFDGVARGAIAFTSVNGNNDQDVLITGINNSGQPTSKLYINNGNGIYNLVFPHPFVGVRSSSIAFADIDGDGDQDVLITGFTSLGGIANLYRNDGAGNYSLIGGTPFDGIVMGSVAFADIDGDGDQDVLITGANNSGQYISKLYSNDGSGNFTIVTSSHFEGVCNSSIAFADIDGDGDQDVLISGTNSLGYYTQLYRNDGSGNFSLVNGTPFDPVIQGSISFADVDGDGDQDVLITGKSNTSQKVSKLYTNDGNGNFSLLSGTPFDGVYTSSVAFGDIDGDNDQDVLIAGENNLGQETAKLYSNDGSGNFTLVNGTPFDWVTYCSVAFADVTGNGDLDVLISGINSSGQKISKLYENDGNGYFTLVNGLPFEGISEGSVAFADIDGDNDQDVLIVGENNQNYLISYLYRNKNCISYTIDTQLVCDSLIWIDGNTYYSNNNTATHTLTNISGCDSVITLSLTIDTIDVSVTQTGATLTANLSGANYQWVVCPSLSAISGAINQSYTPISNGYYAVIINNGTCIDTSSCYSINNIVIEENENNVFIYPNPTSGKIRIECEEMERIELLDITGKLVFEVDDISNVLNIDISSFSKGIYIIRVRVKNGVTLERIVLE